MKRRKNRKKNQFFWLKFTLLLNLSLYEQRLQFLIYQLLLSCCYMGQLPKGSKRNWENSIELKKKKIYNQACEFQKNNPETQYFSKYFLFLWFKIRDCLSTLTPEGLKIVKLAAELLHFKFSDEKDSAQFRNVETNTPLNPGASLKSENPHFSLIDLFSPVWQANLSPS